MNCNQHISSHRHLMVRIYSEMLELVQSTPTRIDLHRYNVEPSIEAAEQKVYFVVGPGNVRFAKNMEQRKARNNGENRKKHHQVWNTGGCFSRAWNGLNRDKYLLYALSIVRWEMSTNFSIVRLEFMYGELFFRTAFTWISCNLFFFRFAFIEHKHNETTASVTKCSTIHVVRECPDREKENCCKQHPNMVLALPTTENISSDILYYAIRKFESRRRTLKVTWKKDLM